MVEPMVDVRVLDAHHVFHVFDHAHHRLVTCGVGADGADGGLADVVLHLAVGDALAELDDGLPELHGFGLVLLEQVQDKA